MSESNELRELARTVEVLKDQVRELRDLETLHAEEQERQLREVPANAEEKKGSIMFCHTRKAGGTTILRGLMPLQWVNGSVANKCTTGVNRGRCPNEQPLDTVFRYNEFEFSGCPTSCMDHDRESTLWVLNVRDPATRHISEFWYSGPGEYWDKSELVVQAAWTPEDVEEEYRKWMVTNLVLPEPGSIAPKKNEEQYGLKSYDGTTWQPRHGRYIPDFLVRFLYSMPNTKGAESRDACSDHTAQNLFAPGYGWYGGPITEAIFEEVKGIIEKFDIILETENMAADTEKLATLLQGRGWWDTDTNYAGFQRHGKLAKNPNSKLKKENANVIRMLEESNVWDRRLHTHIKNLKGTGTIL